MASGSTPRSSSQSATDPKELPERPGPSSTMAKRGRAPSAPAPRSSRPRRCPTDSLRWKGCPWGRTLNRAARSPATAATAAASAVPMLRMPITRSAPGSPSRAAAARRNVSG